MSSFHQENMSSGTRVKKEDVEVAGLGPPRPGLPRSVPQRAPWGLALGSCPTHSPVRPAGTKGHVPMPLLLEASQAQSAPFTAEPAQSTSSLVCGESLRFNYLPGGLHNQCLFIL